MTLDAASPVLFLLQRHSDWGIFNQSPHWLSAQAGSSRQLSQVVKILIPESRNPDGYTGRLERTPRRGEGENTGSKGLNGENTGSKGLTRVSNKSIKPRSGLRGPRTSTVSGGRLQSKEIPSKKFALISEVDRCQTQHHSDTSDTRPKLFCQVGWDRTQIG